MNNAMAPVNGKIVLKSTTTSSLNDRFTRVMSSRQQHKRTDNVVTSKASLKNQRLAEKMSTRDNTNNTRGKISPVTAAPSKKPTRTPLKSRLGSTSKSPKSRLGVVRPGSAGIVAPHMSPINQLSSRLSGQRTFSSSDRRRPNKPYIVHSLPTRNAQYGQSSFRKTNFATVARGESTMRGRGGVYRGQERAQTNPKIQNVRSKGDLDKELDAYMVKSAKLNHR